MTSSLLINEPPLQVLPSLALKIGLNEAIVLQQVHYWLNPRFNKNFFEEKYWVWNTYEKWQHQFPFWGEMTIRRTILNLKGLGLLISFVTKDFKKHTYYTLNYEVLETLQKEEGSQRDFLLSMAENQGSHLSGQNDQIDLPKSSDRGGQNDQIDQANLATSYNIESENTF